MILKRSLSVLSLCVLVLGFPATLRAQSGDYALEFLNIGVGARPLAMGGAFTAAASDATAAYWNPAGLALVDDMQITTMHRTQWDLYAYDFINIAFSTPAAGSYALSYMRLGDDFFATNDGINGVTSGVSDTAGFLSGGWRIGKKMAIGGSIKLIRSDAYTDSAFGIGADLGFLWRPAKEFTVGVMARDFTGGSHIFWTTGTTEVLQPNVTLGFSYTQELGKREKGVPSSTLSLNLDMNSLYIDKGLNDVRLGAEYWYKQFVAARAGFLSRGFQFDSDSFTPSAGVGIWAYVFEIDYAFINYPLGGTHNISIITRL